MTIKSMLIVGVLSLSAVSFAGSKTYEIRLSSAAMAGNVQLPAGAYRLKVDGASAILKSEDDNQTYTAPVKVETKDRKFDQTAVLTNDSNGQTQLKAIELGGSSTMLEFGE